MKKLVALMVAAVMLIALCATASAATPITIWHSYTDDQHAALQAFADEFNASQDEYAVEIISYPNSGFTDTVYQAVANGVGPNIIIHYASTAAEYVKDGLVVDYTPYVFDEEIGMADIYDSLSDSLKAEATGFEDGGMHILPATITGPIIFYNKTVYEELGLEVPTTWEQLGENAKAIYEAKGIAGFGVDSKTDMLQPIFLETGAEYIDVEAKECRLKTDANVAWLDWYGQNVQAGYFANDPQTSGYFSSDFNAGLVATYIGSCAGEPYIVIPTDENGNPEFEYGMAPMPNTIDVSWYPAWDRGPIVFNKSEKENLGAYLFVKYFLTPEVNARWEIAMNALTPYSTTEENEAYQAFVAELPASLAAVQANLDSVGFLPTVTGSNAVRDAVEAAAINVGGGMSAEEAFDILIEDSNAGLQQ